MLSNILITQQSIAEIKPAKINIVASPELIKPLVLQNLALKRINQDVFKGQWDLVFFGYTHCPDICPTTLLNISNAYKRLTDYKKDTSVTFVSVDPARDHPKVIKEYLAYFNPEFKGMSGQIQTLLDLTAQMNMTFYYGPQNEQKEYAVAHSTGIAIIDPQGRYVAKIKNPDTAENILNLYNQFRKQHAKPLFADHLKVTNAWVREAPPNAKVMVAYLDILNTSKQTLWITGFSNSLFSKVEIHETIEENGLANMKHLNFIKLKPKQTVHFKPGEKHLMLFNPKSKITKDMLLRFKGSLGNGESFTFNSSVKRGIHN